MLTLHRSQKDESFVIERRRGLRIQQNRPIKIYEPLAARYIGGQTCDISATGLRIELPGNACVQPGRAVSVHVGPGESGLALANRRQMMPAKVVWVDRRIMDGRMRVLAGVEFVASVAAHLDAA